MFFQVGTNIRLRPINLWVPSGETKEMQFDVECRANQALSGNPVTGGAILCRKLGEVSWVDIEVLTIDLSSFDATRQTFELQITAGVTTERANELFSLAIIRT